MIRGIVYLIQPAEYVGSNVCKVGHSKSPELSRCKNGYKKGTRFLTIMECNDPLIIERNILNSFRNKFNLVNGREYFSGDMNNMRADFLRIVCEHTTVNIIENKTIDSKINRKNPMIRN